MITTCSKMAHKSILDVVWALGKFSKSSARTVCSKEVWSFVSFHQGQIGSCSNWQSCRSRLVLQVCQLHHLLTRTGLRDNQWWSGSVSHWWQLGRRASVVDVADQRQRLAAIWHSYVTVGPARQRSVSTWPPRRHPGLSWSLSFASSPFQRASSGSGVSTFVEQLWRACSRVTLHPRPPYCAGSFAVDRSSSSTSKPAVWSLGELTFRFFPKVRRDGVFLRRSQCRAPQSHSSLSSCFSG
jgi:hypothetical protein